MVMGNKRFLLFLAVCLLFVGAWGRAEAEPTAVSQPAPTVEIGPNQITIVWQTPPINFEPDERGGLLPVIPGYKNFADPGAYVLPTHSVLIALPPTAVPQLNITAQPSRFVQLDQPLAVAGQAEGVLRDQNDQIIGGAFVPADQPSGEAPAAVTLEEIGKMRGIRLARVTFSPIQSPNGQQIELLAGASVTIRWASEPAFAGAPDLTDPLILQVAEMVVNPAHVQTDRVAQTAVSMSGAAGQTAVIEVSETGITAVSYQDLVNAGFSLVGVNPAKLQLTRNGTPVAMEWSGDADAQFESGEKLFFYAEPGFSRWSRFDTYLLHVDANNGARIATTAPSLSGLSTGQRTATWLIEQNNIYTPSCYCGYLPTGRDGDRWVWDDLRQPGRPTNSYTFTVPSIDTSKTADLTAWFIGFTSVSSASPDHKVALSLNGTSLGSVTWDGKTAVTTTATIPVSVLKQTTDNTLTLTLPGQTGVPIDGVWFDGAALRYKLGTATVGHTIQFTGEATARKYTTVLNHTSGVRVYDITNPNAPVKLSNPQISGSSVTFGESGSGVRTYVVTNSAGVKSPTAVRLQQSLATTAVSTVDYLIISHPDFIGELTPLIDLRSGQGLAVAVEDVTKIYDVYNNGRPSPGAIRTFLEDAYATWSPTYVLLVGDGTADPKQYLDSTSETWLMPYLTQIDPWIGEVPSDNQYVAVDGADVIPDMLVGRLSVNSAAETAVVVNKIVNYEQNPVSGVWGREVVVIADNTDTAGNFVAQSNNLIADYIPHPWEATPIYYQPPFSTVEKVVQNITRQWNEGSGLLLYSGHSSTHQWGAERYFHLDDVTALINTHRLPVVLQMTCLTGSFHRSDFETLDEALLRHENGGAVAVWGSSGLGVATGHEALSTGFFDSLLMKGEPTLGTAVLAGKLRVLTHAPIHDELVDTYTLFGDPAMQFNINVPTGYNSYLPVLEGN